MRPAGARSGALGGSVARAGCRPPVLSTGTPIGSRWWNDVHRPTLRAGLSLALVAKIVTERTVRHLVDAGRELLAEPGDADACVDRAHGQVRNRA